MSVLIKICGLSERTSLETALLAGADFVGFVFVPTSPRFIEIQKAVDLKEEVLASSALKEKKDQLSCQSVALVVDPSDHLVEEIVSVFRPDVLQWHGQESPERVREVARHFPSLKMWKALFIREEADLHAAFAYQTQGLQILLDAPPPLGALTMGGHGQCFDWEILARHKPTFPFFLSGGLTPGNVGKALQKLHPRGVDVSSGVERSRGQKDPHLIRAFIGAARQTLLKSQATLKSQTTEESPTAQEPETKS